VVEEGARARRAGMDNVLEDFDLEIE